MATHFTCPHCGKGFEVNLGQLLGAKRTKKKSQASKLNGDLGGAPIKANPKRLRPYHPGHPKHAEWLAEQKKSGMTEI